MHDVTRASLNKVGQNVLTTHFLASLLVCDTIEGLKLAYYELLYKYLYKIDKRLVISIVLHLTTLSSTSGMACLHGRTTSYNLLEGIYANAVAQEVERFCVESCNGCQVGHPSQRQHDCLMMNENERWQMYGLQAIERVNGKRMVWNEFAEAMTVLKLAVDRDVLEHLQQMEKDPDSTFVDSLMELHQNTENHEL